MAEWKRLSFVRSTKRRLAMANLVEKDDHFAQIESATMFWLMVPRDVELIP